MSEILVFAGWFEIFEFTKILWFRRMKEVIYNCHYFVMYPLFNFEPVKGFKCGSNVEMFRGAGDSASNGILNLLKALNLCKRKSLVKRITVIKTRVNEGSGDSSCSGKVKSVTNTTEVTSVVMADVRKGGNLFRKR